MDLSERGDTGSRHPWELARARFFRELIDEQLAGVVPRRILDVGAGDGWFASELSDYLAAGSEIVCWDINYTSQELDADLPTGIQRTATAPSGMFDLVLVMDVLEHIPDDGAFLDREIAPRLGPGSVLVVSVPAYQFLFSDHDVALSHCRRYSPARLQRLLESRFNVVARGGLFASLVPARLLSLARQKIAGARRDHGVGHWSAGRAITGLVTLVLTADASTGRWFARRGLPLPGLSTWAACRPDAQKSR